MVGGPRVFLFAAYREGSVLPWVEDHFSQTLPERVVVEDRKTSVLDIGRPALSYDSAW